MTETSAAPSPPELIGGRYQLLNQLGQGGMGTAHRALDRLSGRVVTLKRLKVAETVTVSERLSGSDSRPALAPEFRLLASPRPPNTLRVLHYAFAGTRPPFLCLVLQEDAPTISASPRASPLLSPPALR